MVEQNRTKFPILISIACVGNICAPSERVFPTASNTVTNKRNKLSAENVHKRGRVEFRGKGHYWGDGQTRGFPASDWSPKIENSVKRELICSLVRRKESGNKLWSVTKSTIWETWLRTAAMPLIFAIKKDIAREADVHTCTPNRNIR